MNPPEMEIRQVLGEGLGARLKVVAVAMMVKILDSGRRKSFCSSTISGGHRILPTSEEVVWTSSNEVQV